MNGWDWGWDWGQNWGWDGYWNPGLVLWFLSTFFVILAVVFLIGFFFLRNLRDLLNRIGPENRAMPPGHVWLNLIPLFGFGWIIYTVIKVRDSVRAEYRSRGWWLEGDAGYGVGMAFAVLVVVGFVFDWMPNYSLSVLSSLIGLGALVCFIMYWVKTNGLKNRLGAEALAPRQSYGPYPGSGHTGGPGASAPARRASYCPACGALYDPGDRFCRSCGRSTPPDTGPRCPACEASPDPGDCFCRSCGKDLS